MASLSTAMRYRIYMNAIQDDLLDCPGQLNLGFRRVCIAQQGPARCEVSENRSVLVPGEVPGGIDILCVFIKSSPNLKSIVRR